MTKSKSYISMQIIIIFLAIINYIYSISYELYFVLIALACANAGWASKAKAPKKSLFYFIFSILFVIICLYEIIVK